MVVLKKCNGCNIELSLERFHKGSGKLGVKSRCKDCTKIWKNSKEYKKNYYYANLEKERESRRVHRSNNKDKYAQKVKIYNDTHKAEKSAREALRRAQKLQATPKWLTKDHLDDMKSMYAKRNILQEETGIIYHVDHIIPLVSDFVCGLHVPWNLQLLPWNENLKKSNKVV